MQFLGSIPVFSTEALLALEAVAFILVLWFWARVTRRRYADRALSDATARITSELERIALAVERLAARQEARPVRRQETRQEVRPEAPATPKAAPSRPITLSMLGR